MTSLVGDLVPACKARTDLGPGHAFDTVAGRSVVLLFFGSAASGQVRAALRTVEADFPEHAPSWVGLKADQLLNIARIEQGSERSLVPYKSPIIDRLILSGQGSSSMGGRDVD